MTLAILCSGQAGQHAAMFELTAHAARTEPIFEAAGAVLGVDPREWVRTATNADLFANQNAQLLCCTQALAAWEALDLGADAHDGEIVLAGYSAGELASWGCAGLIRREDLFALTQARAQAMDAAAGHDGGLSAVRGLPRPQLEALCHANECEIAIVVAEDSFIVGGPRSRLVPLCRQALAAGAQRCSSLAVAVAAHTASLAAASTAFRARLDSATVAPVLAPGLRLLSGVDGDAVLDVRLGLDKLARQISHTLDWQACLTACREAGVTRVLELGPGRGLANMAREALPDANCRALDEFRSLEGARSWLQR